MDLSHALAFAADHTRGVLVTMRRDGHPQLSNIAYRVAHGTFDISITADRAKYFNLRREPWGALHVTQEDFWAYAVFEGQVELTPIAADPHDATVELLIETYRAMAGEHPNWEDYRAAMVKDNRLVARLRAERAYGMLRR